MKITIERSVLLRALNHVQSVVERRNTAPILSNVLIEAQGGSVCLTATDMDISIVETVEAHVLNEGGTTVGVHTLYEITRKLPDGSQIHMEMDDPGKRINLSVGRTIFELPTLPKEEFPLISIEDLPVSFTVPAREMRTLIDRTRFAISTEETRYYLNGIFLHIPEDNHILTAVATDGHRLSLYGFPKPQDLEELKGVIIPRKTVFELRKLIEDMNEDIKISLSDSKINCSFCTVELSSRLIDGTFPDYQQVIPKNNDKILKVEAKIFQDSVDRVATISSDKTRAIRLEIKSNSATLTASSPESGTASDELKVAYEGPELQVGFNARYLLDVTTLINGSEMSFEMKDSVSPTIVRDSGDDASLFVLMPMRV